MRDPACSAGGGFLELIPALTRDTAARIIAGRADAPPHVLAVAEHLFTVVVLTAGSAIGTAVAEALAVAEAHVFLLHSARQSV